MNSKLKELKKINAENSITIILNTHRTFPDNQKDAILLKNLVKDAENRLLADFAKKEVQHLIDKLNALADSVNHRQNLESLILFVNQDIAEFIRLPIPVVDRVVIDNTFATRDLIRGIHSQANYYVLVLNRDEARLIEASNDKVVQELGSPFPFKNKLAPLTNVHPSNATRQQNLVGEFFNQVDKLVNEARKDNPLPILIATEPENYAAYLKVADRPHTIFDTSLNRDKQTEQDHAIVSDAWKIVSEYNINKNNERKADLKKAVSQNKFVSDTNDIYRAIKAGRVQTLFVEQGRFQPAVIENDQITYVSDDRRDELGVIDDIYDELIELNLEFGGDVVFLPKGELDKFNGFGAITRY